MFGPDPNNKHSIPLVVAADIDALAKVLHRLRSRHDLQPQYQTQIIIDPLHNRCWQAANTLIA
ncbi:MAG: hypothetical protein LBF16_10470 [Pseudomonadales bacterium]|jgi:hypothetical protein|nr:hypothetical protein [Pseudomonadales bacterium]